MAGLAGDWPEGSRAEGLVDAGGRATGFGFQPPGPVRDERGGNTALVLVLFVESEGGVADVGPAHIITPVALGIPWLKILAPGALEGAGPVVGAEEEEGVFPGPSLLEMRDETTDVLVNDVHHGGKDLHAAGLPLPVRGGEGFPGGDVRRPRTELEFAGEEPGLHLLEIALHLQ